MSLPMFYRKDMSDDIKKLVFPTAFFAHRVRLFMADQKMSYGRLADLLGIAKTSLYRIVKEKREPTATELMRLNEWLGLREPNYVRSATGKRKRRLDAQRNRDQADARRREQLEAVLRKDSRAW